MEMAIEAVGGALDNLLTLSHLSYLCLGTLLGLTVGLLPGLGGIAGLSLVLPFIFGVEPSKALALMIGLLAPTTTSDTFPAVLMGIPGTSGSQATVMDGFPLAKKGEGARALGAAFAASLAGGLFGAFVLTVSIFAARPVILAIGFGEQLMLVVFALSMIGMLTGSNPIKGLATCGIGLLIGTVGAAPANGELRMSWNTTYLSDGIPLVIIGLSMFAVPEIVDLLRRHRTISETGTLGKGWLDGLRDTIRHWWIVLRCSAIGVIVGALPGLGGSVVDWIAYGHVVQTTRDKERFGEGDIRGVIAPESANNAKEGGALIPTLLFGIPGSGSMALLLGGFILIGIEPGIGMLERDLDLTFTIIWSLAIANVLGAGICLVLAQPIARLTTIPYALIGPIMLAIIYFAAFQASRSWADLIALFGFGLLGIYMKRFGWPRPALLIGYVLSGRLEAAVYQSLQVYGLTFFERPIVIALLLLTIFSIVIAMRTAHRRPDALQKAERSMQGRTPQLAFTAVVIAAAAYALIDAFFRSYLAMVFPLFVAVITLGLLVTVAATQVLQRQPHTVLFDEERFQPVGESALHYIGWIAGMLAGAALVGFPIAVSLFILIFTTVKAGHRLLRNGILAFLAILFFAVMAHALVLVYPAGLLQQLIAMPWWLG